MTEELAALSSSLRALDAIGGEIAKEALPSVLDASRATAAAGTSPEGEAWAPKKDGGRALPGAASAIRAEVSGVTEAVITLILPAPYSFHQLSKGRVPRREILFNSADGIPKPIADAIAKAARTVIARTVGGGRA